MSNNMISKSTRLSKRVARARARRRLTLAVQALESRELLTGTSLLWSVGNTLPAPRGGPAAVEVNGAIVVAGGQTTGSATAVVQSLPTSSSWASDPNIDSGRVGPGFVSTSAGLLYYGGGGGSSGSTALSSAFMYHITGGESNDINSMHSSRKQMASATDASGQAYAIGGVNGSGTNLSSVERYNASTGTWTTVASLPASRSGAAAAFDGSGSIYVVGGSATVNGTAGTTTLYKYNVAANTWTTLASLPYPVRDAAAVFSPDGELQVIGGTSNGSTIATVETYDPASNTWSANNALPYVVSSAAAVVDADGRVEVIGGFNAAKQPLAAVEVTQIVNNPVAPPAFTSTPSTASLTVASGSSFTYNATTSGNPLANYTVVSGPSGLTIDPMSGVTQWATAPSTVGSFPVTLQASNLLGSVTQSFTINVVDKTPPTAPGTPVLTGVGATSVSLSWGASTDNVGVTGYSVYWIYTVGHSGRGGGITTYTILEASTTGATSVTINGLTQNKSYNLYVQAHDAAGNRSLYSSPINVIPGAAPYNFTAAQVSGGVTGQTAYAFSIVANHLLTLKLSSTSFQAPVYSIVSPPTGMTINSSSGVVLWTPGAANLGTSSVTFQSTNQFGTTSLVVSISVTPDYPIPSFIATNTDQPTFDIVGQPVSIQIIDESNTPSTFSLVSGPVGLSIDPVTGVLNWVPTPDEAGNPPETFQLANAFGTATLTLGLVISMASPPQNVTASGLTTWSPSLSWSPPAYDANLVAGYRIMLSGPNYSEYTFTTSDSTLSTSLANLVVPGSTYQVNIQALDANGNQGLWNTSLAFTYTPLAPNPGYYINSNNGNPSSVYGQPVSIQLYDQNTLYPSTYSLVSGPAGITVDPTYGTVSWTPDASEVGLQWLTFQDANVNSSALVTIPFYVGNPTSDTNLPNPTYSFLSNGGGAYAVPGQTMTMQVTDLNTAQPSVFVLVSGPTGMTVDPNSGVVTWTPALSDLGYASPVIEVINVVGVTYLYPSIPVVFASTVNNVVASGSLASEQINVSWTDPTVASEPIAGYDVYLSWVDSSNVTQTTVTFVPYGTYALTLPAVSGVNDYTLTVVAVDSSGNEGAYPASATSVTLS
jgi:N-acetylneuraminic acid mutarotase